MKLAQFKKHTLALALSFLALGGVFYSANALAAEEATTTKSLSVAELETLYGGSKYAPTPKGSAGAGSYNATQIQEDCFNRAKAQGQQTADTTGQMVNSNQSLMDLAKKPVPVSEATSSDSKSSPFSCVKETKQEFDELLGDLLGENAGWINSMLDLFGFSTGDASKSLCGAIRENISETFGFSCSSISPALKGSIGCGANIKVTQNGVTGSLKIGDNTVKTSTTTTGQTTTGTGIFSEPATSPIGVASTTPQTTINQRMLCAFNPSNCK